MNKNCEEFQKIHDEFYIEVNEKLEEFKRSYAEAKENGNVNLGGGKSFFEELEKLKHKTIVKKEKLTAKTPEDINAETRIYLGGFEIGDEEIFQNLGNPLFINEDVDFAFLDTITKIPQNLIFNGNVNFLDCVFLTEIPENTVFNGNADFFGCTFLNDETIEQLKQMKSDGKIKGELTLPDGTLIR